MNTKKRLVFAIAITLLAGMFWNAQAQKVLPPTPSRETTVQGIEISPGVEEDSSTGEWYGCTWLGKTSGQLPGSLFISMNYTTAPFIVIGNVRPQPPVDTITGGMWSLPVYVLNRYVGAVYGHIDSGTMEWEDLSKSTAAVNMTLVIDGGTRGFAGISSKGTFSGTLNRVTKDKPELSGKLVF